MPEVGAVPGRGTSEGRYDRATGFTLLEVLIALGITALLVYTVGASLVLILRSEQTVRHMQEAGFILQSLTTAELLERDAGNEPPHWESDWMVVSDVRDHEFDDPPTNMTWRVWSVAPAARPSLRFETAFRRWNLEERED